MRDSGKLRAQCREARETVMRFEWIDAAWARPRAMSTARAVSQGII